MASPKNFYISLIHFGVSKSNTLFTFSSSILISSGFITTFRNLTFLTLHLHFSSFTYEFFSANLCITTSTTLSCPSSSYILTITLSIKLITSLVLIKFCKISFIIVWNIVRELVSPKNITIGSNDPSRVMNTVFYLSSSFIHILLYLYHKSNFVNTFLLLIFSTMPKIRGKIIVLNSPLI